MRNKYIYIILLVILFTNNIYSQTKPIPKNTIKKNNVNSYLTEHKSIKHDNGLLEFDMLVKNPANFTPKDEVEYYWYNDNIGANRTKGGCGGQLLHGKYLEYYSDGKLKAEINFYLGQKSGLEKQWDKSGEISAIYKYSSNKTTYSKEFDFENKVIIEWLGEPYSKGSVYNVYNNGLFKNIKFKSEYIDGPAYECITKYFLNGTINKKYYEKFGNLLDSNYIEYHENGKIKAKGKYDAGWKIGEWFYYDFNGMLIAKEKYRIIRQYYGKDDVKIEYGEYFDSKAAKWLLHNFYYTYSNEVGSFGVRNIVTKKYKLGNEVDKDFDLGNPSDYY